MIDPQTFIPKEKVRFLFEKLFDGVSDRGVNQFIHLWESSGEESDPREAGSLVAHAYVTNAARIAIFSCHCARQEPRREQWLALCAEAYDKAMIAVAEAVAEHEETKP